MITRLTSSGGMRAMYYEPYEYERPRRWIFAAGAGAVLVALIVVFAFRQFRSEPESASTAAATDSTTIPDETAPPYGSSSTVTSGAPASTPGVVSTEPPTGEATPDPVAVDAEPGETSTSTTAPGQAEPDPGYPTSPDGSPLPLVVVYDTDTITISGQVPSVAAKERLAALGVANSQFPDAQLVDNMVVNAAVPMTVGVRVIELNSVRFPEGSADILPQHAEELDRVVTIMQALPQISVLVVGHADQRGDDLANFAISDERARAVVNYLLYLGISQTRMSSRAAGESDLLTLADDDDALALNRRTEFIFYGLLIE